MSMTKKDYQVIADVFSALDPQAVVTSLQGDLMWTRLRNDLAVALLDGNSRFDRGKFYTATRKK